MLRRTPLLFAVSFAVAMTSLSCGDPNVSPKDGTGTGGASGTGQGGRSGTGTGGGGGGFMVNPATGGGSGSGTGSGSGQDSCGTLLATMRDFKDDHADFEKAVATVRGLVKPDLGPDHKPVYAPPGPTAVTSGAASFDQWYRDVAGVNMTSRLSLPLTPMGGGVFVYENNAFFPLDGQGFGNQNRNHNFHFTTEIHASFKYNGGERFTFKGDDDVFVFVNGKLALDLGGVHGVETATVDFDQKAAALGITKGMTYRLDVFHAERHTSESNFRIETSIACLKPIIE